MTDEQRKSLPGAEWLDRLLDCKLQEIVEALESGEKLSVADFERVIDFKRREFGVDQTPPEIEWVDNWEEAA